MSEWSISFVVQGKSLEPLLIALVPFKVDNMDMHPVVQKGAQGKKGGEPGWSVVERFVSALNRPVRPVEVIPELVAHGFNKTGISTHIAQAVRRKLIKKTPKGYIKGSST